MLRKDTLFIYKSISLSTYKGSGKMYQNAGKAGTKMRTCTWHYYIHQFLQ